MPRCVVGAKPRSAVSGDVEGPGLHGGGPSGGPGPTGLDPSITHGSLGRVAIPLCLVRVAVERPTRHSRVLSPTPRCVLWGPRGDTVGV